MTLDCINEPHVINVGLEGWWWCLLTGSMSSCTFIVSRHSGMINKHMAWSVSSFSRLVVLLPYKCRERERERSQVITPWCVEMDLKANLQVEMVRKTVIIINASWDTYKIESMTPWWRYCQEYKGSHGKQQQTLFMLFPLESTLE